MLKGIDPLLNPELLRVLAQMGHGDEIVLSDANFPSESVARQSVHGLCLRMDVDSITALRAVLTVLPLDRYEPNPVLTMQVVDEPDTVPEVVAAAEPLLLQNGHRSSSLERFAFYERAKTAFAVIRCLETRPYGNFILRKGVV